MKNSIWILFVVIIVFVSFCFWEYIPNKTEIDYKYDTQGWHGIDSTVKSLLNKPPEPIFDISDSIIRINQKELVYEVDSLLILLENEDGINQVMEESLHEKEFELDSMKMILARRKH